VVKSAESTVLHSVINVREVRMIKARIPAALILLLLCGIVANSEPQSLPSLGKLVVQVTDESNAPVSRAFVYIHNGVGEEYANFNGQIGDIKPTLDRNGRVEVRLSTTYYDLFVAASGFLPDCRVVHIEPGKTTEINVKLHPDTANLQQ